MIYTLTLNPSLDYVVSVENFSCGKVNRTTEERIFPGGKGINVSMVLSNLGIKSTALGFVAGFTGEQLRTLLEEKNVATDFIKADTGATRINVKLRSTKREIQNHEMTLPERMPINNGLQIEETEINGIGPFINENELTELYNKLDKLKREDVLVLAGSVPKSVPDTIYMDIMEYLQNRGIDIVVDTTGDLLKNVLKFKPFLIKPNHHELGELFRRTLDSKEEILACAKVLHKKGARNVLISMAGDGAILVAEDENVYELEAPKGKVINSVGAGDSMVAGFLTGYLNFKDYTTALKLGVCTGSASAFSENLATKEEVEALLQEI